MAIINLKNIQRAVRRPPTGGGTPVMHKPVPAPEPEAAPAPAPAPEPVVEAAPAPAPEPEAEKLTMANTKAQLVAAADAAGVELQGGWTKAQILDALYASE